MKKNKFVCNDCGHSVIKWVGKCSECHTWNSFVEEDTLVKSNLAESLRANTRSPQRISEIREIDFKKIKTNINEFDRVVGDGLTLGSLTLIGGEPGVGKSTLLMEVCSRLATNHKEDKILYISGEESAMQVANRAKRLLVNNNKFLILNETSWQIIKEHLKNEMPKFLVLDSIQTTVSNEVQASSGSISQIREVTYELMNFAKNNDITCLIIGHVSKGGAIAGPKMLEHMVDTVLYFEGDRNDQYRVLRAVKNRFGSTSETGVFEMSCTGLREISNPSQYFLNSGTSKNYGRSVTSIMEGTRPIFVEVEALVVENKFATGKRTTQGIDVNRLLMIIAIIEKYMDIPITYNDIYVDVVGGLRISGRESDLSIIASLISSHFQKPLFDKAIYLGEVGLTGDIRPIRMAEARLKQLEDMSYQKVFVSNSIAEKYQEKFNFQLTGVNKVSEIKELIF